MNAIKPKIREFANATEAYRSVESILHKHVLYYKRRCGGDYAEMLAEANYAFMLAWSSWDHKHQLTTWVWHTVKGYLRIYLANRQRPNRLGKRKRVRIELTRRAVDPNSLIGVAAVLDRLSDDSRYAAEEALRITAKHPSTGRRALLKVLISLGWTGQQVIDTFQEIRSALQ